MDTERLDIPLTDYATPLFCSGCKQEFEADKTVWVADYGSAFPQFCSEQCADTFDAKEYRIEDLTDDHRDIEFVRLVELVGGVSK